MATYSIFGTGAPAGVTTFNQDASAYNLGTAFSLVSGTTGWQARGIRVWLAADSNSPTSGFIGHIWHGSNAASATLVGSANFGTMIKGAWNTATLATPINLTAGDTYWVSAWFPGGCYVIKDAAFNSTVVSADAAELTAPAYSQVSPGNGALSFGSAGTALTIGSGGHVWYGVDVLVSDAAGMAVSINDGANVTETVSASRSGFADQVTFNSNLTDPLGASSSDTKDVAITGTTIHTERRVMNRDRLVYGSTLGISKGADLQESTPTEVGLSFYVMRPVRLTQARIFKHHLANGTIPVTLWDTDGTVLATKTLTWAADDGGFRYVTFDTPVNLVPNHEYKLTYFAASGHFAGNLIAYFVQDTYEPPFLVKRFDDVARTGGGMYRFDGTHGAPDTYFGSNYWCDPVVEYEVDLPACGPGYLEQFTNYQPNHAFPMGVFFADPEWLVDYASIGINTLINGSIANPGFREAILASGMDVWASHDLEQYVVTDPPLADQVVGYFLSDEPDLAGTRVTPQGLRDRMAASRRVDSSRPMMLNFGFAVAIMQGYNFLLEGQTLASAIPEWMEDMMIADVISLDIYTLAPNTQQGQWGVWTYPVVDQRLRNFSDNTKAVFGYVESTGQQPGYPLPDDIRKATWAHLISGVQGIVYFDHRFEAFGVTQDFAAMLHHTPTRTMMQDLTALVQALAGPLKAPEAGLVTAVASSNTTAGPLGGVYGVPIHYTSRIHGTRSYIFAMGIRPGATTATFTVPDAAGKTITVRGEGRTKTVASDGTFTDTFAADYSIHLYEWTTLPIASTPDPTPPPSPPPAPVANEFGWTEPTWVRPSGAGYVRYEDLYTTGDTLQEVINKVTNHNVLTFPEGTFTFSDFSYGGTVGINVGPNCGGLMGSGRNTIFQMVPGSSTKASLVPAQSTGATNPLWMMRIRDNDGAHFRGFRFIGTDQGHLYNGLGIQYSADSISSHLYLQAASWGDEKSPPGETFSWGNNHADRCKLWDSEIDGRTPGGLLVGASPLGWNNSVDADVRRVYAHHSRAGMPTWWQTTNIYTEDLVHYYTGDGHGLNHENSEGHIMHVRPVLIVAGRYSERSLGTSSGLHVNMGNAATDMTDVTFVDPVYDDSFHQSGGMCIAQYAGWNIGGPNQVVTYPTVIHNGVTKTVYNGRTVANPGNFVKSDTFVYN